MLRLVPIPVASFLLTAVVPAQTRVVSPVLYETREAPGTHSLPFLPGQRATQRWVDYMEIHDLPATRKGKVAGLRLRREGLFLGSFYRAPTPAFWANIRVTLSTAKVPARKMTKPWSANHGSQPVTVLKPRKVQFASIAHVPVAGPQPFLFKIPFDRGTSLNHAGGSLVLQILVQDNDLYDSKAKTHRFPSFDFAHMSLAGRSQQIGRGCSSSESHSSPFTGRSEARLDPGRKQHRLYGSSHHGLTGGIGVDLMAASLLVKPVQLPGSCILYVDTASLFLVLPGSGIRAGFKGHDYDYPSCQGTTRRYLWLPELPSVRGASVYSQKLGIDPKANSMGLILSNATWLVLSSHRSQGLGVSRGYGTWSGILPIYSVVRDEGNVCSFEFL